jgi:hypothetical protein
MDRGGGSRNPQTHLRSSDADGVLASQLQHPVQDRNGDADLGRPTPILARAHPPSRARSPVTDDLHVAPDGGLEAAPFVIARHLLPPDPAVLGNPLEMAWFKIRSFLVTLTRGNRRPCDCRLEGPVREATSLRGVRLAQAEEVPSPAG